MTQFFKVTPILVFALFLQACNGNSGSGGSSETPSGTPNPDQNQCAADLNEPLYFEDAAYDYETDVSADLDTHLIRTRAVKVNIDALKAAMQAGQGRIRLDLYSGLNVSVLSERIEKYSDSNYVLTGRIEGEAFSSVSLAIHGDVLVGNLNTGKGNRYVISYKGEGIHNIDEYEAHEDGDEDSCMTVDVSASSLQEVSHDQEDEFSALATTPVIDMLVAYTPYAKTAVGGEAAMMALIQTGIADTNKSLIDSGVNLQVRLVGVMPVAQNETGAWSSDLGALSSKTDSRWNEVHAERARLGADQVSLVANYSGSSTAGIGYIKSTASTAFTITKVSAFKNFSFTHELGHNVGLNHTDGYVNNSGSFRTIMAYGTVTRIARFSNPLIQYRGYTTGTSSQNSAAILNKNGPMTSNLVAEVVPITKPDIPIQPPPPGDQPPVCP